MKNVGRAWTWGGPWMERAFIGAGLVLLAGLAWHHMAILGDGFWYVFSGRFILQHRGMPHEDPFCYASVGRLWVVFNAGSAVLWAVVTNVLGLEGLLVWGALLAALSAAMLWLGNARSPMARLVLLPLAVAFIAVDAQDLSARGQLFGDIGFVFLLTMLGRLRDGRRVNPVVPLLLGATWVNLHMSFLAAPLIPLVVAASLLTGSRVARPPLRPFVAFAVLELAGCCANAYGPRYIWLSLSQALDPRTAQIDLFRSPDFHDPAWLIGPAVAIALLGMRERFGGAAGRRPDQILVVIFLGAACMSRRYGTELIAVEAWVVGRMVPARPVRGPVAYVRAGVAAVCLVTGLAWLREQKDPLRDVPAEAARMIADQKLPDRVMNPLHWGGYLGYAWNGAPRYFIDGRDQMLLFGNGAFEDEGELWTLRPDWERVLDLYEVNTVLWVRGSALDQALRQNPGWSLVHEDRIAVVYVRRPRPQADPVRRP